MSRAIWIVTWLTFLPPLLFTSNLAAQEPAPESEDPPLPALLRAKPLKEDPNDDELKKLLKARYNEAVAEMRGRYQQFMQGRADVSSFSEVAQRLAKAGLEMTEKPTSKVQLLTQYVELMKYLEKAVEGKYEGGVIPLSELNQARYFRLDAEIQLVRAKREVAGEKKQ